jgi:hypothetical protein
LTVDAEACLGVLFAVLVTGVLFAASVLVYVALSAVLHMDIEIADTVVTIILTINVH